MDFNESEQVMLYVVKVEGKSYFNLDPIDGLTYINSMINADATVGSSGYTLHKRLYDAAQYIQRFSISNQDLGITILMLWFGKYYSRNQYELYTNQFRFIEEFSIIEKFLMGCTKYHIKLAIDNTNAINTYGAVDLAVHEIYGIKLQSHRFINTGILTIEMFRFLEMYMTTDRSRVSHFLLLLEPLHINIVESFYNFTSVTRNLKMIIECNELGRNTFYYKLTKFERTTHYTGDYWFVVPNRSVWFAHRKNCVKYFGYVSKDCDALLSKLTNIPGIVTGFICNNQMYPVQIVAPEIGANWSHMIEIFQTFNLPIVLTKSTIYPAPLNLTNLYFVNQSQMIIKKYIK